MSAGRGVPKSLYYSFVENLDPALFQENERTAAVTDARRYAQVGSLCGIPEVTIAYETWGELSASCDNAVLICHALSGDSHAIGWWERMIGPGKAIDTDRYFVIGTNCVGGCQGSTGPSSPAPDGRPWGSRFPLVRIEDMIDAQERLLEQLGIDQLLGVAGGSMGGMMALEMTRRGRARKAWITASTRAHTAMQIGFNEVARQAIVRDPQFLGGDYYGSKGPVQGLSVARMTGHLTYLSEFSFAQKFGRRPQEGKGAFGRDMFQVESYLSHQGDKFTQRFDANTLIVVTNAIDVYDPPDIGASQSEYLITSFGSDWIYPSHLSQELDLWLRENGLKSRWVDLDSPLGHDSFLLDAEGQGPLVQAFFAEGR